MSTHTDGSAKAGALRLFTRMFGIVLAVAVALLPATTYAQAPTNYFVPQTFANFTSASAGTLDGNTFTVATTGTFDNGPMVVNNVPGSLPAGTGFPSSAPDQLSWGSLANDTTTVTFEFNSPLQRNCHIYILDVDQNEQLLTTFWDGSGNQIAGTAFFRGNISTVGLPSVFQSSGTVVVTGVSGDQDNPTFELVPTQNNTTKVVIEGTSSPGGDNVSVFFACSKPALSKSFSPDTVQSGQATTLTFDIAVYKNPLYAAGFVDTLPSGLEVANPANITNSCTGLPSGSIVTATPGGNTITYSDLSLTPFSGGLSEESCTVTVDVVAKTGQTNPSCATNPPAFTNGPGNMQTTTLDTSNMTDVCLTVAPSLAVTLAGFDAQAQAGHVLVTWETVSELGTAGFNLYRTETAEPPSAADLLTTVPSQGPGSTQGFFYSYRDNAVTAGETYWYWLEDVDLSGATTIHGPVSVVFTAPTAVTLSGLEAAADQPAVVVWPWLMALMAAAAVLVVWRRHNPAA